LAWRTLIRTGIAALALAAILILASEPISFIGAKNSHFCSHLPLAVITAKHKGTVLLVAALVLAIRVVIAAALYLISAVRG
jgi:hypothetical protein